ncbi:MAG: OPT/YSL family transporter, partial [Deltaproteobacteria bacterium]|nr:OPT/YSL family transporter [Deltaproteobacteria bacterium]
EQLPFPSSVAAAHTIAAMHAGNQDDPSRPTRAPKRLLAAASAAGLWTILRDLKALPFHVPGSAPLLGGLSLDLSPVLLGGGALMPWRTAAAVAAGALVANLWLAPWALANHWVAGSDYRSLLQLNLWPGAGLMVAAGVVGLLLQWRTGLRALTALIQGTQQAVRHGAFRRAAADPSDPDAPLWWFAAALAILGPLLVLLMATLFGIPWWLGLLSLPVPMVLGAVAARVTGETDVTPSKALGPVTQLMYGGLLPGALTANLMGANVTGGVGLHAADTLGDLKCGWVLGATPKLQLWAQLFGIGVGALAVVPAFHLLVPSAAALGTAELPAPAVQVWASLSHMLAGGAGGLPAERQWAAAAGAAVGAVLAVAEAKLPRRWRPWVPSPTALGIAFLLPGSSAMAMFAGATLAALLRRRAADVDDAYRLPVASGLVAGESLTGMALVLLRAAGLAV